MSPPGPHHEVVVVGDVLEISTDESDAVVGVILIVDAEAPCEVSVMFPAAWPGVSVGDRLWVRSRLAFEPMPNRRGSLYFVQARSVDPVKRRRGA
jgi:hypothetical protein